jgi:hypothetical protein
MAAGLSLGAFKMAWIFRIKGQPDYDFSGTFDEVWQRLTYMVGVPSLAMDQIESRGVFHWDLPTYFVSIFNEDENPPVVIPTPPPANVLIPALETMNADEAIAAINGISGEDEATILTLLLDSEEVGKNRKSVIAAIKEKAGFAN